MDAPFDKLATITDVHFGRSNGSPIALQDNHEFLDWFIDRAKTRGVRDCAVLGDWHDSRHSLMVSTIDSSLYGMEKLSAAFDRVWFLTGNHDLMYREKRDVASTVFAKHLPNITLINNPLHLGDGKDGVTFMPWMVGDEQKTLKALTSRYIFAHAEINGGFMMNAKVVVPDHEGSIGIDAFDNNDYLFSGHYHFRQAKGRVVYTGNICPFNYADVFDTDRGAMFLDWAKEPVFEEWPDQPTFGTFKLSEIMAAPDRLLRPKMSARVDIDLDLSFEESQHLRDNFATMHNMRKLELIPRKSSGASVGDLPDAAREQRAAEVRTVDQMISHGLDRLEPGEYDSVILKQILADCIESGGK